MPITPRDIKAAYMFRGSRADFLIRCKHEGSFSFESIDTVPRPHNWATWNGTSNSLTGASMSAGVYGQKENAWTGVMAIFNVAPKSSDKGKLDEIRTFRVARPCYAPEMRSLTPDDSFFFIQGGLAPPPPSLQSDGTYDPEEVYQTQAFRYQPSTSWSGANLDHGNFYVLNDFQAELNAATTAFPGRLLPPKGSPACDGKITNGFGECYGPPPPAQDFS